MSDLEEEIEAMEAEEDRKLEEEESKEKKKEKEDTEEDESDEELELDEMEVDSSERKPEVKIKITKTRFLIMKTFVQYEDGTEEYKDHKYEIKKVNVRENEEAGPEEERFLYLVKTEKGKEIFVFLLPDRAINSVEIDGEVYLARGH